LGHQFVGMYFLILVVIGVSKVRGMLFNKVNKVWNENIPRINNILKIIDHLQLARFDFDFDK
jgi:hypothetical protein